MLFELYALRHAKSAWPIGVTDLRRPLAKRGIRNAVRLGAWLVECDVRPDLVVVSPALRTRQTVDLVAEAAGFLPTAQVDDRLYGASWGDVLDVVRQTPASVKRLMIVGHNPSLEDLAAQLAGPDSDIDAVSALRTKFPTCALAHLRSESDWPHWGSGQAELSLLHTPRTQS